MKVTFGGGGGGKKKQNERYLGTMRTPTKRKGNGGDSDGKAPGGKRTGGGADQNGSALSYEFEVLSSSTFAAGNVQWLIRRPPLKTTPSGMEGI